MDLLDLLKLMVRRWYVTAPVLLGALAAALVVGGAMPPEYKTTSAVLMVPPTVAPVPGGDRDRAPGNPWLRVGEAPMAQAVQIALSSHEFRQKVAAQGGDPSYEMKVLNRSAILTVDVTTDSEAKSLATVTAVNQLIRDEVEARQAGYPGRPGEQITTEVLDSGLNITNSRSSILRVQIVTVALGFLIAAVLAALVDVISRLITRRRGTERHLARAAGQAPIAPRSHEDAPEQLEPVPASGRATLTPARRGAHSGKGRSRPATTALSTTPAQGDLEQPVT